MNLNIKNKILLFVALILILFTSLMLYVSFLEKKDTLFLEKKQDYKKIDFLFKQLDKNIKELSRKSMDLVVGSRNLYKIHKDKKLFYQFLQKKYNLLQKSNKYIYSLKFHTPDGRVYASAGENPNGGEVSITRSSIYELHQNKQELYGFEVLGDRLIYRAIKPIFDRDVYIGAFEVDLQSDYILNEMNYYYNIEGVLLLKNAIQDDSSNIKNYTPKHQLFKNINLLHYLDKSFKFENYSDFHTSSNLEYTVYVFNIEDSIAQVEVKVLFFSDRTSKVNRMKEEMTKLAIFYAIGVLLILLLFKYIIKFVVLKLENQLEDALYYKNLINRNLITFSTDLNGQLKGASEAFCKISGYQINEIQETKSDILKHYYILNSIKYSKTWIGELQQYHKNRTTYWVHTIVQPKLENEIVVGCDVIMYDITQEKLNDQLLVSDKLTNIYNQKHFKKILPSAINNTKRYGGYLSLIIIDVDRFKQYNDKYGTKRGDETLISIASSLEKSLKRSSDYCFRIESDEFAVIFNSDKREDALIFTQTIKDNIEALSIKHLHNTSKSILTISLGLVTYYHKELVEDDMMYYIANENLYKAKSSGRNQIVYS